jgi:hypothetical protein
MSLAHCLLIILNDNYYGSIKRNLPNTPYFKGSEMIIKKLIAAAAAGLNPK